VRIRAVHRRRDLNGDPRRQGGRPDDIVSARGGLTFSTRDTAQLESWGYGRRGIHAVTIFLQADGGTGDVRAWFRVSMDLRFKDADTLEGNVDVAKLECVGPALELRAVSVKWLWIEWPVRDDSLNCEYLTIA